MSLQIVAADLSDPSHGEAIVALLSEYAAEPGGGSVPLSQAAREALIPGLRDHPSAFALLAMQDGIPVGVAVCLVGYSTFAAQRIVNIHDLAVSAQFRGRGIGGRLLAVVETRARELDAAKLTLEVYADNAVARSLYRREGFGPPGQQADFWVKRLSD